MVALFLGLSHKDGTQRWCPSYPPPLLGHITVHHSPKYNKNLSEPWLQSLHSKKNALGGYHTQNDTADFKKKKKNIIVLSCIMGGQNMAHQLIGSGLPVDVIWPAAAPTVLHLGPSPAQGRPHHAPGHVCRPDPSPSQHRASGRATPQWNCN